MAALVHAMTPWLETPLMQPRLYVLFIELAMQYQYYSAFLSNHYSLYLRVNRQPWFPCHTVSRKAGRSLLWQLLLSTLVSCISHSVKHLLYYPSLNFV